MNTIKWWRGMMAVLACTLLVACAADDKKPAADAGDAAWQEVQKAFRPPAPPAEWRKQEPTPAQVAEFEKSNGVFAGAAADKAKAFYTQFPQHAKVAEAKRMELKLLDVAVQLGHTNRQAQLNALQEARLKDPTVPASEKFDLRAQRIMQALSDETETGRAARVDKAEQAARDLQEDFPKRDENFDLLLQVAQGYLDLDNLPKARDVTEEVAKKAQGDAKQQAQDQLKKLDMIGQPFDLQFADLNGKETGLKNLAGKVVLVDFWATWCGPCKAALPEVKEVYAKFHGQGFEILGISLDKDKDTLKTFIADEKMTWPQYFDGLGWENKLGQKFGITSIPTVWLVDKKGHLRDLNGRQGLAAKVEKLLAEK